MIAAMEIYPYLTSSNYKISSSIALSRFRVSPSCLILGDSQISAALRNNINTCINMAAGGTNVLMHHC